MPHSLAGTYLLSLSLSLFLSPSFQATGMLPRPDRYLGTATTRRSNTDEQEIYCAVCMYICTSYLDSCLTKREQASAVRETLSGVGGDLIHLCHSLSPLWRFSRAEHAFDVGCEIPSQADGTQHEPALARSPDPHGRILQNSLRGGVQYI